jgi:hypothetical protein
MHACAYLQQQQEDAFMCVTCSIYSSRLFVALVTCLIFCLHFWLAGFVVCFTVCLACVTLLRALCGRSPQTECICMMMHDDMLTSQLACIETRRRRQERKNGLVLWCSYVWTPLIIIFYIIVTAAHAHNYIYTMIVGVLNDIVMTLPNVKAGRLQLTIWISTLVSGSWDLVNSTECRDPPDPAQQTKTQVYLESNWSIGERESERPKRVRERKRNFQKSRAARGGGVALLLIIVRVAYY